jgi:hypothetical protein
VGENFSFGGFINNDGFKLTLFDSEGVRDIFIGF